MSQQVLSLLTKVLGTSSQSKTDEHSFYCPFCHHRKKKLQINVNNQMWHCWVCNTKGRSLFTLFKRLSVSDQYFSELKSLIGETKYITYSKQDNETIQTIQLPDEYIPLWVTSNDIKYKEALTYLSKRGILKSDIYRYRMGYCKSGKYANRIIIPSYDENFNLNYFVARKFVDNKSLLNYLNPDVSRDIIPFATHIDWEQPIILVEGIFDAIAVKRNAIPLLGKTLSRELLLKIFRTNINTIYISLDSDAIREIYFLLKQFYNSGIQLYFIECTQKDPADIGYRNFIELKNNTAKKVDFSVLFNLKMKYGIREQKDIPRWNYSRQN